VVSGECAITDVFGVDVISTIARETRHTIHQCSCEGR
jgi:hypothetical protein